MTRDLEQLQHDIGYAFNSMEAEHFHNLLIAKDIKKAEEMLKKYFYKKEINIFMTDILDRYNKKVSIEEIKLSEVQEDNCYLIKVGPDIFTTYYYKSGSEMVFSGSKRKFLTKDVIQVWKIN